MNNDQSNNNSYSTQNDNQSVPDNPQGKNSDNAEEAAELARAKIRAIFNDKSPGQQSLGSEKENSPQQTAPKPSGNHSVGFVQPTPSHAEQTAREKQPNDTQSVQQEKQQVQPQHNNYQQSVEPVNSQQPSEHVYQQQQQQQPQQSNQQLPQTTQANIPQNDSAQIENQKNNHAQQQHSVLRPQQPPSQPSQRQQNVVQPQQNNQPAASQRQDNNPEIQYSQPHQGSIQNQQQENQSIRNAQMIQPSQNHQDTQQVNSQSNQTQQTTPPQQPPAEVGPQRSVHFNNQPPQTNQNTHLQPQIVQPQTQQSESHNTPPEQPQPQSHEQTSRQAPKPHFQPSQPMQETNQSTQPSVRHEQVTPSSQKQNQLNEQEPNSGHRLLNQEVNSPLATNEPAPTQTNSTQPSSQPQGSYPLPQQQSQPQTAQQQQSQQNQLTSQQALHEIGLDQKPVQEPEIVMQGRQTIGSLLSKLPFFGKSKSSSSDEELPSPWKPLLRAIIIGVLAFGFLNSQIIVAQVKHFTNPTGQTDGPLLVDPTQEIKVGEKPRIIIPKINVNAPVVYDEKSFDEERVQKALHRGVVHYGTTAMPGEKGNNVIVGHSSANWWDSGEWKFAFVLLDKLERGDTFELHYKSKRYVYKVTDKFITDPSDVSVLKQTEKPTVTLITCNPPGSAWRRLIIKADQISPDPSLAKQAKNVEVPQNLDTQLPSDSPTLLDKLRDWIF